MQVLKVTMSSGERYEIPQIWIAGFCRRGGSVQEAVAYWHEQDLMEREFQAQNGISLAEAVTTEPINSSACYCSSLGRSVYADKNSPSPRCDFCTGLRRPA